MNTPRFLQDLIVNMRIFQNILRFFRVIDFSAFCFLLQPHDSGTFVQPVFSCGQHLLFHHKISFMRANAAGNQITFGNEQKINIVVHVNQAFQIALPF